MPFYDFMSFAIICKTKFVPMDYERRRLRTHTIEKPSKKIYLQKLRETTYPALHLRFSASQHFILLCS